MNKNPLANPETEPRDRGRSTEDTLKKEYIHHKKLFHNTQMHRWKAVGVSQPTENTMFWFCRLC